MAQVLKNSWVKNDGEGLLPRIDTIFFSLAAKQQFLWFNTTIESFALLIEKIALSA